MYIYIYVYIYIYKEVVIGCNEHLKLFSTLVPIVFYSCQISCLTWSKEHLCDGFE